MAFIARGCGRDLYTARARSASAVYRIETTPECNKCHAARAYTDHYLVYCTFESDLASE